MVVFCGTFVCTWLRVESSKGLVGPRSLRSRVQLILLLHIPYLLNVTGGYDGDSNKDILEYKDGWKKVGQLQNGRRYHGTSPVNFKDFANYCNN